MRTDNFRSAKWATWRCAERDGGNILSDELVACEIEIESGSHDSGSISYLLGRVPENRWMVVQEGSLRGGFELVSVAPMPVNELLLSLSQVAPAFEGITDTFRAAVHIHCNVQYFTREQYMKAVVAYSLLEPSFYEFCGEGRDESVFCVPWTKGYDHVHKLTQAYYANDNSMWAQAITGSPKYSGCNLKATSRYGSIEFRHMPTPSTDSAHALGRIAAYLDRCNTVIRLALDEGFKGEGMLEFADFVIANSSSIPVEHLCHVYSAIALERPLDRLVDGIASSTVRRTVATMSNRGRGLTGRRSRLRAPLVPRSISQIATDQMAIWTATPPEFTDTEYYTTAIEALTEFEMEGS